MGDIHILVFGDSIAYGAWDPEGGWVQRLRRRLDKITLNGKGYYLVYNLGVSGDTSREILSRFESEAKIRLDAQEKPVIIFAFGTNDCVLVNKKKEFKVPEKEFRKNLSRLSRLAKKYADKIVFVGLTPVDEAKMDPVPWAPQFSAKNEFIEKYDEMIKSFCTKNRIHFIGVFSKMIKLDYRSLLYDGDHPNSKGHEKLYEIISDYLQEKKII